MAVASSGLVSSGVTMGRRTLSWLPLPSMLQSPSVLSAVQGGVNAYRSSRSHQIPSPHALTSHDNHMSSQGQATREEPTTNTTTTTGGRRMTTMTIMDVVVIAVIVATVTFIVLTTGVRHDFQCSFLVKQEPSNEGRTDYGGVTQRRVYVTTPSLYIWLRTGEQVGQGKITHLSHF